MLYLSKYSFSYIFLFSLDQVSVRTKFHSSFIPVIKSKVRFFVGSKTLQASISIRYDGLGQFKSCLGSQLTVFQISESYTW